MAAWKGDVEGEENVNVETVTVDGPEAVQALGANAWDDAAEANEGVTVIGLSEVTHADLEDKPGSGNTSDSSANSQTYLTVVGEVDKDGPVRRKGCAASCLSAILDKDEVAHEAERARRREEREKELVKHAELEAAAADTTGPLWQRGWRKLRYFLAFVGPGMMVAVGYADPGNWSTDITAGSQFGYTLLFVILLSNLLAIFLQTLALRLGIITGRDLAQSCRETLPRWINLPLYALTEIAICATDLAEVIGSAIALNLLFSIPLVVGVAVTGLDALLLLAGLQRKARYLELFIVFMMSTIFIGFVALMAKSDLKFVSILRGYVPSKEIFTNGDCLYAAIAIVGATVMPHNLFLASAVSRDHCDGMDKKKAVRMSTIDLVVSLLIAFFINSAILIVAAANFYEKNLNDVAEIEDAYYLLQNMLGKAWAVIFAIALLAAGQSSTITGTVAGTVVMEGFLQMRVRPWVRRLITRLLAIIPAVAVTMAVGSHGLNRLLVISQVILSMQLPFSIFPLVYFTSNPELMGNRANSRPVKYVAYGIATFLAGLNMYLLYMVFSDI